MTLKHNSWAISACRKGVCSVVTESGNNGHYHAMTYKQCQQTAHAIERVSSSASDTNHQLATGEHLNVQRQAPGCRVKLGNVRCLRRSGNSAKSQEPCRSPPSGRE